MHQEEESFHVFLIHFLKAQTTYPPPHDTLEGCIKRLLQQHAIQFATL